MSALLRFRLWWILRVWHRLPSLTELATLEWEEQKSITAERERRIREIRDETGRQFDAWYRRELERQQSLITLERQR